MDETDTAKTNYLTPKEVAATLGVSPITIRQWAQKGDLPSVMTQGGHRRFKEEDVSNFAQKISTQLKKTKETLRILIVDDDPEFSNYLEDILSSLSPSIVPKKAADGFAAGKELFLFQPHIVLLDLRMPGISGVEVCKSTKRDPSTQYTRIIAMTGHSESSEIETVIEAGAECCLTKPIFKEQLLEAINISKYPNIFTGSTK
ncbi:MAG: response regulator [Pseudomonadales bacterium]|nr:response regulator [Pseudomonadales bacterium]